MIFLLGRQAILGQEPPINFRSMTTARIPFLAKVQAMYLPASPLPSTTTSYSSGCVTGVCIDLSGYLAHCAPTFFLSTASACSASRFRALKALYWLELDFAALS